MTPIQTIQTVYDAFSRGDIAYIVGLVAPDASWRQSKTLPWGGDFTGPDGAAQFFSRLNAEMETTLFTVHENIAVNDEVISFGVYGGKGRKSGLTAQATFAFRWKVVDGRIVSYDAFIDSAALLTALSTERAATA